MSRRSRRAASRSGAATDGKTGMLVIVGVDSTAEVYDPRRVTSVSRTELHCSGVFDIAARDGIAWIGTSDGTILRFDVGLAAVTGKVELAPGDGQNYTRVDLDATGRHLAASVSIYGAGDIPTILKVYRVGPNGLTETASARANLPHVVNHITLLDTERVTILDSHPVFAWHYDPR